MSPVPGRTDQTGLRSAADRTTEQAAHSAETSAKPANDDRSTDETGTAISADDRTNGGETQKQPAEVAASGADGDPTAEGSPSADNGGGCRLSADGDQEVVDSAPSVSAASPPPEGGQNGTNGPSSPARPNGAEEPATPAGDAKQEIHDTSQSAQTSEQTEEDETLQSSNQEPPKVETVDLAPVPTNGRDSSEPVEGTSAETTTDPKELKPVNNLKSADNREPLEAAPDQTSAVSVVPAAVEGADSTPPSVEPSAQVSDDAASAAAGGQPEPFGSPPVAGTGPAAPATNSGMTEIRSIWVVGSEEHLPGAVGGEDGGAAAASWATVNSTVRAIRVFRRGVSKRLRRPASHDRQHEPAAPPASRNADRQLSQPAASEPQHEPAAGGFLRSLSFRRSASWRGRHARDHQQGGGAAGGGGDALDAAMLQTATPVPLQPHVNRTAFSEACAAYEPSQKPGGPAADLTSREKKESQLKEELRTSYYPLDHPSRHQLWSHICQMHGATLGQNEEYESTVRQLEGDYGPAARGQHQIPPFVHSFYMNRYALSEQGVWTAERLLAVLYYNNPAITYAPSLYPICCLMLHYMDEADTYNALNMMLRNKKQGYLLQTKRDFEIAWKILIKLCRKHTKTSLHFLQQEARAGDNVEHVLADWLAWLFCFLPFAHAVRLMDCYLMEGEKVLYRGAMAVVLLVHKMASHQLGDWAYSFKEFTVQEVIEKFCTNMQLAPEKLLKTMFGIRGFSRESLTASYARVKAQIKAGGGRLNFPERRCTRSVSKQQSHPGGLGMPSVMSQDELAEASSTIGVKELLRLWENLPARYALYTPLLIYTSDEHGFSLKTFYQKVATFEPTVLLLRTTEGAVFGAYCSVTWNCRNQSQEDGSRQRYFGTGETFLFTLRPRLTVYPWVGKVRQAEDPELAGLSHSEQLFMAADNAMVTIGGGGGQAIWLDENLSCGKTDACETFANPPLTPSGSFEVACMEAFAFSPA